MFAGLAVICVVVGGYFALNKSAVRVFDRFWRADPSRKRTIGGTGLGLSIALGDARLHGGTLAVWSELGRGTNFVLTLPVRAGDEAVTFPLALDPGEAGSEPGREAVRSADR